MSDSSLDQYIPLKRNQFQSSVSQFRKRKKKKNTSIIINKTFPLCDTCYITREDSAHAFRLIKINGFSRSPLLVSRDQKNTKMFLGVEVETISQRIKSLLNDGDRVLVLCELQ